jgi:streptogramin lyase
MFSLSRSPGTRGTKTRRWPERPLALEKLEDRCLLSGGVSEYPTPTAGSFPFDIASGTPDGNVWFTEFDSNKIGRITPAGVVTEFPTQTAYRGPLGITHGPNFNDTGYWFAQAGGIVGPSKIERIDGSNGAITNQIVTNDDPKMIVAYSNISPFASQLFYTDTVDNRIGRINTPTSTQLPYINLPFGANPWGITLGGGSVWWTEPNLNLIGRYNLTTTTVSFITIPVGNSLPRNVTAGPNGIWFTEQNANRIGTLDFNGQNYHDYTIPTSASQPWGITTVGSDVWFTESAPAASKVGRLDTGTGTFREFGLQALSTPYGITQGSDGNVWFDEYRAAAVGKVGLDKPLTATGLNLTGGEGGSFIGVAATFTDADPQAVAGNFTARIDWGNGFQSAGTIVRNGPLFEVHGNSNGYSEEGSYPVTVTITDIDDSHDIGGSTAVAHSTINVQDAPLEIGGLSFDAGEGSPFTNQLVAYAVDTGGPEPTDTATIDWGDQHSTSGSLSLVNGLYEVRGSHTYNDEGQYTVRVTVNDEGHSTVTGTSTANVQDAGLSVSPFPFSATEGAAFSATVARFTDAAAPEPTGDYTAGIYWGDGSPVMTGQVTFNSGTFYVSGSHTYAEEGPFTVVVTVQDAGQVYKVYQTITVADAALSGSALPVSASEGATFNGPVATFTDADPNGTASDYSATVTWGDSHVSAGLILPNGPGFQVVAPNAYGEEGSYPVSVTISDFGGSMIMVNTTATVADSPLAGLPQAVSATAGVPLMSIPLGIFVDQGGVEALANYTATITWGDSGLQDMGTVSLINPLFLQVTGTHTYTQAGPLTATVTLLDEGSSVASIMVPVTVNPGPADHFLVTAPASVSSGTAFDVTVTVQDAFNNTVPGYDRTIQFSTSDADPGVVLPANYPFNPGTDQGVHFFDHTQGQGVTLITAGAQTLTVTDTISGITGSTTVVVGGMGPYGGGGGFPGFTDVFSDPLEKGLFVSERRIGVPLTVPPTATPAGSPSASPGVRDGAESGPITGTQTPASRPASWTGRPLLEPPTVAGADAIFAEPDAFSLDRLEVAGHAQL